MKTKTSSLQTYLTVFMVCALMVSNTIGNKQALLPFGLNMSAGCLLTFPITYILSDVFSEVYGYKWSRRTSYLAFACNVFMILCFMATIKLPFPAFWKDQQAFEVVLGNTPRLLIASLSAFLAGDFVNDRVFRRMKAKHMTSAKGFGSRAIVSSFCGQVTDSLVFTPIAFLGVMDTKTLALTMVTQAVVKTAYELLFLPLTFTVAKRVQQYESRVSL